MSRNRVRDACSQRTVFSSRHYRQPLRLASLILRNLSLIDRVGSADASAFTVDMNVLFQDWVTDRLARHLRGRLRVVAERTEHLGVGRKIPMYPDLELWAGDELVYVSDVKYKLTGSGLARNADYYQLLAYVTALGLGGGRGFGRGVGWEQPNISERQLGCRSPEGAR